jgi:hypothetical protein
LEADFQRVYGLDLEGLWRGDFSPRRAAALALNLPRGSQVWVMLGGERAVTAETEALWLVEHAIVAVAHAQGGGKGQAPKVREYPEGVLVKRDRADARARSIEARARRLAAKQTE